MDLEEYIEDVGTNPAKLAEKANISSSTMYNILKGQDYKISVAGAIRQATKGQVTCDDLYEMYVRKNKKESQLKVKKGK